MTTRCSKLEREVPPLVIVHGYRISFPLLVLPPILIVLCSCCRTDGTAEVDVCATPNRTDEPVGQSSGTAWRAE